MLWSLGGVLKSVYNLTQVDRMERVRRNIMIPASLDKELDTMSEALGDTRSSLVSKALGYYFDMLDLDIAKERARRIEAGETKPLTGADLRKALGF